MTDTTLTAHVVKLAALREEADQRSERIKAARAAFEATIADDVANLEACKRSVEATEAEVRGLALIDYDRTQNAKPAPGVSIVKETVYTIDEPQALAFAHANRTAFPNLITEKLNAPVVKKLVSAGVDIAGVTVAEVPATRLATDLAKALDAAAQERAA